MPIRVDTSLRAAVAIASAWGMITSSAIAEDGAVVRSPAFDAANLAALPREGWVTNGGNLANQRYSPLDQINRGNVRELRAVWRASLEGSGIIPQGGNQAEPLYYDGTLFIVTSENDVFAIDVDSGEVRWKYEAKLDPAVAQPCCGWAVRGLAMGDGKIYMGRLDAQLVALDQHSGEVVWSVEVADPHAAYSITSAPRYYDGMVITGTSGGVMGTRGRVDAYNASTGALIWRFYTIPGPGELGHDTWPEDSDVWQYGGAAVWQTPAVDPELGLVYFSTGNPGPVLNGAVRAGDNLFSVSMVAVDAATGEYRWHFQQVRHDIWDYDASNPVILFDAVVGGDLRQGIAQAGKTGWVYILDRTNGEPLIGIEDRPVPQEPRQKTAATQPFPIGDPIVPQHIDIEPENHRLVNDGRIFTPFFDEPVLWKPLAGVNWPPSSYDPRSNTMFICASDGSWGATGGDPDFPLEPDGPYAGGVVYQSGINRRGIFAALDVTTNRLVWRRQWPDQCYSGSITTAGGLVFVGRNDGRLTALDTATGDRLWEFQTDGGVNAPAITFERNGTQYIAAYAGGTSLAPSKRSDGLWLFSLEGTLEPLPRGAADPAGQFPARRGGPPGPPQDESPAARRSLIEEPREPDIVNGRLIYRAACLACHGATGTGGTHGGSALTGDLTHDAAVSVVADGAPGMPAFGNTLSAQDMRDLTAYLFEELLRP